MQYTRKLEPLLDANDFEIEGCLQLWVRHMRFVHTETCNIQVVRVDAMSLLQSVWLQPRRYWECLAAWKLPDLRV